MDIQNDDLLTRIHQVSLYILLAFDKVCRDNELTYFLDSGTALGAVRHGGFIPWDDDIDVGMPRKDYERFLKIGRSVLPEDILIQTRATDPSYKRNAAKLRLKGTIFQEHEGLPYKENGFFIDIFPFDNVPRNKYLARMYVYGTRQVGRIIGTWYSHIKSQSHTLSIIQAVIKKIPESCITWINMKYVNLCRRYENQDPGYFTSFFWAMSAKKSYIFDSGRIIPVKEISFEGHPVKIVKDHDYYLNLMYGDYMQLPPEKDRHGHHAKGQIDFGRYIF